MAGPEGNIGKKPERMDETDKQGVHEALLNAVHDATTGPGKGDASAELKAVQSIQSMTADDIRALQSGDIKAFTPKMVEALTVPQIEQMTPKQIGALTESHLGQLTPQQNIAALTVMVPSISEKLTKLGEFDKAAGDAAHGIMSAAINQDILRYVADASTMNPKTALENMRKAVQNA